MNRTLVLTAALTAAVAASADELREIREIAYSEASPMCTLNLKWPAGRTGFATVVNFHGGGLTGDGSGYALWPEEAGTNDCVAHVGVRYRLLPKEGENGVGPADCIDDAAAAVAWTLRNIAQYGGDPKKVFVTGVSAGGYLTAMIGMDPQWLGKHGFGPLDLCGIAPLTGQVTKHFNVRSIGFKDKDPRFAPKVDEWAPLFWAKNKDIPPAWFMTGGRHDNELPCRVEENEFMVISLLRTGHKNVQFHETEGSHGGGVRPSGYFLRDFVMKYGDVGGIGRLADGEKVVLKGGSAALAANLQLFQALMKPEVDVRVLPDGKAGRGARVIDVRTGETAGDLARRMCYESLVAQVSIDAAKPSVRPRGNKEKKPETRNAVVTALVRRGEGLAFDYLPKALPLPARDEFASFNRELFVVEGLASGEYALAFDGQEVGRFSAEAFASGVNVAFLETPNRRLTRQAEALAEQLAGSRDDAAKADDLLARLTAVRPLRTRVTISR